MRIAIVGTGYVGLCTGVLLAELGHDVTLVDIDPERVDAVNQAQAPFHEPDLDEALARVREAGRLRGTVDIDEAVPEAEVAFLCVGTPRDESGQADLSAIEQAARDIGEALPAGAEQVVVTKSTVPPGTTETLVRESVLEAADLSEAARVSFAMNPEFLAEGSALADARKPDKVVLGVRDEQAEQRLRAVYADLEAPVRVVDPATAELIKYANNAILATKVSLANELANLCNEIGADWNDVAEAVGLDERISGAFLRAGAGFGGSCFPKDVSAIRAVAEDRGVPSLVLEAVLERNERQPDRVVDLLEAELGSLQGRHVALLGLSFKPGTDDVRGTRALPIHRALVERGAEVRVHDPEAVEAFQQLAPDAIAAGSLEEALTGAEGVIVQTAWPAYAKLSADTVRELGEDAVVVDGRRALDEAAFQRSGLTYRAIGLGRAEDV
jgi:UDPglucose 6-dehydrogenase